MNSEMVILEAYMGLLRHLAFLKLLPDTPKFIYVLFLLNQEPNRRYLCHFQQHSFTFVTISKLMGLLHLFTTLVSAAHFIIHLDLNIILLIFSRILT